MPLSCSPKTASTLCLMTKIFELQMASADTACRYASDRKIARQIKPGYVSAAIAEHAAAITNMSKSSKRF